MGKYFLEKLEIKKEKEEELILVKKGNYIRVSFLIM